MVPPIVLSMEVVNPEKGRMKNSWLSSKDTWVVKGKQRVLLRDKSTISSSSLGHREKEQHQWEPGIERTIEQLIQAVWAPYRKLLLVKSSLRQFTDLVAAIHHRLPPWYGPENLQHHILWHLCQVYKLICSQIEFNNEDASRPTTLIFLCSNDNNTSST